MVNIFGQTVFTLKGNIGKFKAIITFKITFEYALI